MKLLLQHIRWWGQKAKVHTEQGSACKQASRQAMQAALAARKEQAGKLASSRLTGGALRLPHVASKLSQLELSRVERRDILPDTSGNVRESE